MTTPSTDTDPALAENIAQLAEIAGQAGADGVWVLRGAFVAALGFAFGYTDSQQNLLLERPHGTIVLIRFPASDCEAPGIERV